MDFPKIALKMDGGRKAVPYIRGENFTTVPIEQQSDQVLPFLVNMDMIDDQPVPLEVKIAAAREWARRYPDGVASDAPKWKRTNHPVIMTFLKEVSFGESQAQRRYIEVFNKSHLLGPKS